MNIIVLLNLVLIVVAVVLGFYEKYLLAWIVIAVDVAILVWAITKRKS